MTKTEEKLNQIFSDIYSEEQVVDLFIYLTNKNRGKTTTENNIKKSYRNNKFASLLKRLDPVAYNVLKRDEGL